MLGRWGVRLHPFKPPGQDCFQALQLSEQWLPHTWVSMPVWVFPCNPISDSSHKGLHLPVLWFLLPLLAAIVSLGKCELVREELPPSCCHAHLTASKCGRHSYLTLLKTLAKAFRYAK